MRAVVKLVLVGMAMFAVAFALRRIFFSDVMPVSWTEDSSPTGALIAAYLLLSLENVGVGVAAIALLIGLVAVAQPPMSKAIAPFRVLLGVLIAGHDAQRRPDRPTEKKWPKAEGNNRRPDIVETTRKGGGRSHGSILVARPRHHLAVKDVGIRRTFHAQDAEQAAFGAGERVVDQDVVTRHPGLELSNHRTARRDAGCLDAFERRR
jgi:hypothetical protein